LAVDEFTNNGFILIVVSKNMSLLSDEFKSFVADFDIIDIKIDASKVLEEQFDKMRFKSNNNIFYLLSFKNQAECLYSKTQIRLIKQLVALKESMPAFVIIQFDEYYDSGNALYSILLFK